MDEKLSQYLADHCQTVNPGGACIFIGDIHGQFQKLKSLFSNLENFFITNSIQNYWENASIIFLGDYQDRGKYGKETIDFLSHTLPEMYPKQSHYFILGNHDFAFMSFLDIIESDYEDGKPEYDLTIYIEHHEKLWFPKSKDDIHYMEDHHMLVQGYRYCPLYESKPTFKSYKAKFGRKLELMNKVPESHKEFYRSLKYVQILYIPNRGYVICVHGGLLSDIPVIQQLDDLLSKKLDTCIKQAFYRADIVNAPPELLFNNVCIVSGHHGYSNFDLPSRIIIDTCAGNNLKNYLQF